MPEDGRRETTFYNWKKKYGELGVSELRRLKQLEEENRQLKKLVAGSCCLQFTVEFLIL